MGRSVTIPAAKAALLLITVICCAATPAFAQDRLKASEREKATTARKQLASISGSRVICQDGSAGSYPCKRTDMTAFLSVSDLAAGLSSEALSSNDIWGWTDPETGVEYALVGMNSGTSFVDISDPVNPKVVGFLPTHTVASTWRDIKVYADHAFIVSEASAHGMQVFDLNQLRTAGQTPVLFEETAHYGVYNDAHNIAINEDTGFAYVVGANGGGTTCGGGLHMIDISTPAEPAFAGCFTELMSLRGYSHDVQCVLYAGPDSDYQGREVCVGSNENSIVISDVTDKSNPELISHASYPNVAYAHQGWFSEDQMYFFLDDELDEPSQVTTTRTIIWDMTDLNDPIVAKEYLATSHSRDHNQYVVGDLLFQSNYSSGLRILDITEPTNPVELAFFDTIPGNNDPNFDGSWSNYPFFESGIIAVTSIDEGLFLLNSEVVDKVTSVEDPELPDRLTLAAPYPNPFDEETTLTLSLDKSQHVTVEVYDLLGRQVALLVDEVIPAQTPQSIVFKALNLPNGQYIIRAAGRDYTVSRVVTLIR